MLIANIVRHTGMIIYLWTSKGLLFKARFQYADESPFTDEFFKDKLSSTVKSLEPNHIVQYMCDDDDPYLAKIWKEVFSHYPRVCTANCAFNMIANIICWTTNSSHKVSACATMIFLYITNNNSVNVTLGREQKGKESDISSSKIVMRDSMVMTSEALAYLVTLFLRLKSVLAAQDALQASQVCTASSSSRLSEQSSEIKYARFVDLAIHCEDFWECVKLLVEVLQPLLEALCLVACNGGTIGYLYQAMERAKNKIEEHKMISSINYDYDEMYSGIIGPMHEAAALFDPAYMLKLNLEENRIDHIWSSFFDDLVEGSNKKQFRAEFNDYCSKDSNILTSSALDKLKTFHPGKWWESFGVCVPVLQKYALRIVIQPCTSNFFTDDELRSIILDETDGQFRTKKMMMDRSGMLNAPLQGSTNLDYQLTQLYEFARQEETEYFGYNYFLSRISSISEDFWDASQDPSFHLLDNWSAFSLL